jgi:hypothetical protein
MSFSSAPSKHHASTDLSSGPAHRSRAASASACDVYPLQSSDEEFEQRIRHALKTSPISNEEIERRSKEQRSKR